MPLRCVAAPSSVGAGILLQSTSSRFFWFMVSSSLRRMGGAKRYPSIHLTAVVTGIASAQPILRSPSSPRPHQAALLPAPVALLLAFALVVQLLALGDRQQQFGAA